MRANFEQKAMRALGLQDKDVETCVKGGWSNLLYSGESGGGSGDLVEPLAPVFKYPMKMK